MTLFQELNELSPLRKNQQIMSFFLLFVNALLVAVSTIFYVRIFGSDGLILKNYAISLLGLLILIPVLGKIAIKKPLATFHFCVFLEALSVIGYILVAQDIYAPFMLLTASFFIFASNLLMKPVLTQVDSIVTNGCGEYSLIKSKMDNIYLAIGALIGALFIILSIPIIFAVIAYSTALGFARYYRHKVLIEIYTSNQVTPQEPEAAAKMA